MSHHLKCPVCYALPRDPEHSTSEQVVLAEAARLELNPTSLLWFNHFSIPCWQSETMTSRLLGGGATRRSEILKSCSNLSGSGVRSEWLQVRIREGWVLLRPMLITESGETGFPFAVHGRQRNNGSSLAEVGEYGVDELKGLVHLLADLGTGQNEFARDEDEKHDLGFHHAIDESREELGFV